MDATTLEKLISPFPRKCQELPNPEPRPEHLERPHMAWRLGCALLAVGVLCRLGRYLLRFPIWGDEASLCVNFLDRDFFGLVRQLDGNQVAPLLFLWSQKAVLHLVGGAEWAMRLLPFLAGLGSLALFWHLAFRTVRPLPAALAVGLLAVGRWPVSMSCFAKPYSCDLLFSLALVIPAIHWLEQPKRWGRLALLACVAPLAVGMSYPAVFVGGGVVLALALPAWRQGGASLALLVLFSLAMGVCFLAHYLLVGRQSPTPGAADVVSFMREYWAHGFPPRQPLSLAGWLVSIHAGRMMAYPVGDGHGGSSGTLILFVVGAWTWWRTGRQPLLFLFLAPFGLNLVAAFWGKFPYGGCCRLSQHLAPAVCLLAGSGLATLIERLARNEQSRRAATWGVCIALMVIGLAGLEVDLRFPYRDREAVWNRDVVHEVMTRARPEDQVVILNPRVEPWSLMIWHLGQLGQHVTWSGRVDWQRLETAKGRLWCLDLWTDQNEPGPHGIEATLASAPDRWAVAAQVPYTVAPRKPGEPTYHADLYLCAPDTQRAGLTSAQLISCFP